MVEHEANKTKKTDIKYSSKGNQPTDYAED
jgi:hypothetical protein